MIFGSDLEMFLILVGCKCHHTATAGFHLERGHCARLRLYWYNCLYNINLLHTRTCCSPVTTLCRFQRGMAEVCALASSTLVYLRQNEVTDHPGVNLGMQWRIQKAWLGVRCGLQREGSEEGLTPPPEEGAEKNEFFA